MHNVMIGVIVFMSFFVQFIVFKLLLILYFVPTRVLILNHPGPGGGAPGCGVVKPPAQIFFLQISVNPAKTKYKIVHIPKTKNRTKKVICAKNERQVNYNLTCKFGHFWRKLNRDMMWYDILCPSLFSAYWASFKMTQLFLGRLKTIENCEQNH